MHPRTYIRGRRARIDGAASSVQLSCLYATAACAAAFVLVYALVLALLLPCTRCMGACARRGDNYCQLLFLRETGVLKQL